MRILITGCCVFVGIWLSRTLKAHLPDVELFGLDNLIRPGSEANRSEVASLGLKLFHGDLRATSDIDALPRVDVVIDAAANPAVMAGIDGKTSSRQIVEHNLLGSVNLLEYCRRHGAAFILLSTSRVYSIESLISVPIRIENSHFAVDPGGNLPQGATNDGIKETFSTQSPVSLYGATKIASEVLALEYGTTFQFPVWINRCGILAGAGQFGRPDQGIISYWINSWLQGKPLKYIGFNGTGYQTRDCLHPRDLVALLLQQIRHGMAPGKPRIVNLSGGKQSSFSLAELSAWCAARFGERPIAADLSPRPFDIPWVILDHSQASATWNWQPEVTREQIFEEIAIHAENHADWIELSSS